MAACLQEGTHDAVAKPLHHAEVAPHQPARTDMVSLLSNEIMLLGYNGCRASRARSALGMNVVQSLARSGRAERHRVTRA